jgi:microcystin-dependent protein
MHYFKFDTGDTKWYAGSTAPTGTLLCDGTAVNRTTYLNLFAVIGTTFGSGDGVTTFNLPNAENRSIIGAGGTYSVGATGGSATHTLTTAELPAHTHTQDAHSHTVTDPGHTHTNTGVTTTTAGGITAGVNCGSNTTAATINAASTGITINNATPTNQNTGGGLSHNNLPPHLALIMIIKY